MIENITNSKVLFIVWSCFRSPLVNLKNNKKTTKVSVSSWTPSGSFAFGGWMKMLSYRFNSKMFWALFLPEMQRYFRSEWFFFCRNVYFFWIRAACVLVAISFMIQYFFKYSFCSFVRLCKILIAKSTWCVESDGHLAVSWMALCTFESAYPSRWKWFRQILRRLWKHNLFPQNLLQHYSCMTFTTSLDILRWLQQDGTLNRGSGLGWWIGRIFASTLPAHICLDPDEIARLVVFTSGSAFCHTVSVEEELRLSW